MALTRDFRATVMARVERDPRFREALLAGALTAHLEGDMAAGRALLRDLVNATLGFEALARATGRPAKSLHRMLSPAGNPTSEAFFSIVRVVARAGRMRLVVRARASVPSRPSRNRSAA
jgi:DNA-binding phage protein